MENHLLKDDIRNNTEEIKKCIHKDFIELTTSGNVYKYSKGDKFGPNINKTFIVDDSFDVRRLSFNLYQVIYKTNNIDGDIVNRSSIWKKHFSNWKIIFHQGTRVRL